MKKQERGRNENKKQGSRAVKPRVEIPALEGAAPLSCRASHSSREYLAHGDTFLCQHPAKVAPGTDYPTRAGHGCRRWLPALPCQGEGCLPPLQGARAAAAAPVLLGEFWGGFPHSQVHGGGEMRVNSSFLLFAGGFFCDGTWRFWSLQILGCLRCRAPCAPGRECDALVTAVPPLPATLLWEDAEA